MRLTQHVAGRYWSGVLTRNTGESSEIWGEVEESG